MGFLRGEVSEMMVMGSRLCLLLTRTQITVFLGLKLFDVNHLIVMDIADPTNPVPVKAVHLPGTVSAVAGGRYA